MVTAVSRSEGNTSEAVETKLRCRAVIAFDVARTTFRELHPHAISCQIYLNVAGIFVFCDTVWL